MFRNNLLACTALVGCLAVLPGAAGATDYTASTFTGGGTLAGSSSDSLTVGAGETVTTAGSTAAVVLTNTNRTSNTLSLTANGTISNTNAAGRAVDLNSQTYATSLSISVGAAGSITAGDDAIRINKALVSGSSLTIDNAGTIASTVGQALDLKAMSAAGVATTITNRATGLITNDGSADLIRPGAGAVIVNYGVICGGTFAAGACTSTTSGGDGIDGQSNSGITVTNKTGGLISGAKHGITGDYGSTVTNEAGATIEGRNGSGVNIDNADINATTGAFTALRAASTVTNYGTITGAGTDGDGVDVDGQVILDNYGTIRAQSATAPNTAEAVAAGGGTIINRAGATLVGAHNGILIDNGSTGTTGNYAAALPTTITNAGTIEGQNGYAVKLVGSTGYGGVSLDDTLTNSGTIRATVTTSSATTVIDMGGGNDTLTTSGTVSGTGTTIAIQMGDGNDTLNVTGGSISGGSLEGGAGTDTLAFFNGVAQPGRFTFDGAINGFETIRVYGGTVVLRGAIGDSPALSVDSGAMLRINPSVTLGSLALDGSLLAAEDSATRTLTVSGAFSQGAGGILEVRIKGATAYDTLVVSGTATLANGATIRPLVTGYVANGAAYTIVSSAGLTATPGQLAIDYSSPLLTWALSQSGNDLVLTASRTQTFATVSSAGGAAAAGAVLEGIGGSATGDMASVILAVQSLGSQAAVGEAMQQLAPTPSGGALQGSVSAGRGAVTTVQTRLAALRAGQRTQSAFADSFASPAALTESGRALAALSSTQGTDDALAPVLGIATGPAMARAGVWTQAFGSTGDQGAIGDSQGYKSRTGGFALGGDLPLDRDTVVGFAGSFARSYVDGRGLQDQDRTRVDSYQFTAYGSRAFGDSFVEGIASVGANRYESKRVIGVLNRTASADYQGWQTLAKVTGGHTFPLDSVTVTPLVSVQYAHAHLGAYTETGAGSVSLAVDGQDYDTLTPGLGARLGLSAPVELAGGLLSPQLSAAFTYDVIADRQSVEAAFTGGGGAFISQGAEPARAAIALGLGAAYRLDDTELSAGYQLDLRESYVGHLGLVRLRQEF